MSISIVEQSQSIDSEKPPERRENVVLRTLKRASLTVRNYRQKLEENQKSDKEIENFCKPYNSIPKNIKMENDYEIDMESFPAGNITPESIINNLQLRVPDALRKEVRESMPDLSSTDCQLFVDNTLTKRGTLVLGERLGTRLSANIVDLLVKSPRSPEYRLILLYILR